MVVGNTLEGVGVGMAVDVAAAEKLAKVSSHHYVLKLTMMLKLIIIKDLLSVIGIPHPLENRVWYKHTWTANSCIFPMSTVMIANTTMWA